MGQTGSGCVHAGKPRLKTWRLSQVRRESPRRNWLPRREFMLGVLQLWAIGSIATAWAQAPDPGNSTYVLNLTTFATNPSPQAIELTHAKDGSGRIFVSSNDGKIHAYSSTGAALGVFLNLSAPGVLPDFDSTQGFTTRGLSFMAFHPDYGRAGAPGWGKLYTFYKSLEPGLRNPDYSGAALPTRPMSPGNVLSQYVVTEWTVQAGNSNQVDTASRREVIRIEYSGNGEDVHSVGRLSFNPFARTNHSDYGLLYIPLGDMNGGGEVANWQHVQDANNPFGKILRINPLASGTNRYSVPASNPFYDGGSLLDNDSITEEIAAWGFRNPQNTCFAKDTNGNARLVVFDIGAVNFEEVNLVDVGDNHGWTRYDGPSDGNLATTLNLPAGSTLTFPATVYDHNIPNVPGAAPTAGGTGITGGFVVSEPGNPGFQNQLVFGDLPRGAFFHADWNALSAADAAGTQAAMFVMNVRINGGAPGSFPSLIGSGGRGDVRFGVNENGRMFIISKQTRTIFATDLIADQSPPLEDTTTTSTTTTTLAPTTTTTTTSTTTTSTMTTSTTTTTLAPTTTTLAPTTTTTTLAPTTTTTTTTLAPTTTTTTLAPTTTTTTTTSTTTTTLTVATFRITNTVCLPGGNLGFSWEGPSGVVYEVWWTDNLMDGWPSGQVETTTGSDWAGTNLLLQRRFYRIGIEALTTTTTTTTTTSTTTTLAPTTTTAEPTTTTLAPTTTTLAPTTTTTTLEPTTTTTTTTSTTTTTAAAAVMSWAWECDVNPTTLDSQVPPDGINDWVARTGSNPFDSSDLTTESGLSVYQGTAGANLSLLDTRPLYDATDANLELEVKWKTTNDEVNNDYTSILWWNMDYSGGTMGKVWCWVNRVGGNTVIHMVNGDTPLSPITVTGNDYFTMRWKFATSPNTCDVYINGSGTPSQSFTYNLVASVDKFVTVGLKRGKGYIDYVHINAYD